MEAVVGSQRGEYLGPVLGPAPHYTKGPFAIVYLRWTDNYDYHWDRSNGAI